MYPDQAAAGDDATPRSICLLGCRIRLLPVVLLLNPLWFRSITPGREAVSSAESTKHGACTRLLPDAAHPPLRKHSLSPLHVPGQHVCILPVGGAVADDEAEKGREVREFFHHLPQSFYTQYYDRTISLIFRSGKKHLHVHIGSSR